MSSAGNFLSYGRMLQAATAAAAGGDGAGADADRVAGQRAASIPYFVTTQYCCHSYVQQAVKHRLMVYPLAASVSDSRETGRPIDGTASPAVAAAHAGRRSVSRAGREPRPGTRSRYRSESDSWRQRREILRSSLAHSSVHRHGTVRLRYVRPAFVARRRSRDEINPSEKTARAEENDNGSGCGRRDGGGFTASLVSFRLLHYSSVALRCVVLAATMQ